MGFQSLFQGRGTPQITSQGSANEYVGHNKGDRGLNSSKRKNYINLQRIYLFFFKMYLLFLRIYVGFQSPFQGKGMPQITSQGSLNEFISHNKGY